MGNVLTANAPVALTAAFTTLYTVPAATNFAVGAIHVANTDSSARTFQMVINTGSGDNQTQALAWNVSISPGDFIEFGKGLIFAATWKIDALASSPNVVVVTISGVQQS